MPKEAENDIPRFMSLVRFNFGAMGKKYHRRYPFIADRPYVFFGEIPNMPHHCVVADHVTGQIYSGYHTGHFAEIPSGET